MPDSHSERERLVRLEVQMANLTNELSKASEAIEELTEALHQMRGGVRMSLALGVGISVVLAALWTVGTWAYDKLGRGA